MGSKETEQESDVDIKNKVIKCCEVWFKKKGELLADDYAKLCLTYFILFGGIRAGYSGMVMEDSSSEAITKACHNLIVEGKVKVSPEVWKKRIESCNGSTASNEEESKKKSKEV